MRRYSVALAALTLLYLPFLALLLLTRPALAAPQVSSAPIQAAAATPPPATVPTQVATTPTSAPEITATATLPAPPPTIPAPTATPDIASLPLLAAPQNVTDAPVLVRLRAKGTETSVVKKLAFVEAVRAGRFQPIYYTKAAGDVAEQILALIATKDVAQFQNSGLDFAQIDPDGDSATYYSVVISGQSDIETMQALDDTWKQIDRIGDHVFFKVRLPAFVGFGKLSGLQIEKLPPRIHIADLTATCPCQSLANAMFSAMPPALLKGKPLANTIGEITENDLKATDVQFVQNEVRGQILNTRYTGTKGSVYMAERLYTYFFALGLNVSFDSFVEFGLGTVAANVVAQQPGEKKGAEAEPIVITGHYDSLGVRNLAGDMDPALPAYGANDNGTGIVGMMQIARLLVGHRFSQPITYLATGAEEQGMLGSKHYTATHLHPDIPKINLNIDSFGYNPPGADDWIVLGFNHTGLQLKDDIVSYEQKYKIGLRLEVRRGEAFFRSDDYWFDKHGIDAVVLTDSFALQSPNNHTANDTVANVNFQTSRKVTQLALVTVAEYAGLKE